MSTKNKADKIISLRLPENLLNWVRQEAEKDGRTVSNYLKMLVIEKMGATEYLMSSPANVESLERAIQQVKDGEVKSFESTEELLEYVKSRAQS